VDVSRRHSLNNVATLFGMPAKLDFKGATALEVVAKVEEIEQKKPGTDLSNLTDFSRIESFVEEIDLFKVEYPPEIVQISDFTWVRGRDGAYVLLLKDRESVIVYPEFIRHSVWRIVGTVRGAQFNRTATSFENAIREADQLVRTLGGRATASMIARAAKPWQMDPASPDQIALLRMFKLPIPEGLTKGQARDVLNRELAKRKGAKK